jgi:NADP-dependent 3-hydroxy acid dehydrogenase YdfG
MKIMITGATAGFGEAAARIFAKNGHSLILTGRRQDRLDKLKQEFSRTYPAIQVVTLCFDVQNQSQVNQSIQTIPVDLQSIDVLINNAGLALGLGTIDEGRTSDWDTMIDTNIKGLLYVTQAVIPFLKKTQGHIINIGSTAAKDAYPKGNIYCATKAAVDMLSKTMRVDLLPHQVRVTAIHPGAAETEFSLVRFQGDVAKAKAPYEGFQPLSAHDVAQVIYFCATIPKHFCINDLVLSSTAQANSNFYFKQSVLK